MSLHAEESEQIFFKGLDINLTTDTIEKTASQYCLQNDEDSPYNLPNRMTAYQQCLISSVKQQVDPDSLRRMVTTDLRYKRMALDKEFRKATSNSHRFVISAVQSLLAEEHKKRVWAFGPIAENGGPQWKE